MVHIGRQQSVNVASDSGFRYRATWSISSGGSLCKEKIQGHWVEADGGMIALEMKEHSL